MPSSEPAPPLDLSIAWERVLRLAWASFVAGTTPVGAVVVGPHGAIVSEGRGRRWEADGPAGELWGCDVAHAELNALAHLPIGLRSEDHILVTSLEPCAMCHGAAVQSRIRTIAFAAPDPYAGTAHLAIDTAQGRRRPIEMVGPLVSDRGALATVLHVAWLDHMGTADHVVAVHRDAMPGLTGFALNLGDRLRAAAASDDFNEALVIARDAPLAELAQRTV